MVTQQTGRCSSQNFNTSLPDGEAPTLSAPSTAVLEPVSLCWGWGRGSEDVYPNIPIPCEALSASAEVLKYMHKFSQKVEPTPTLTPTPFA